MNLHDLGFHKSAAKYTIHQANPVPMNYDVDKMNSRNYAIMDKAEGTSSRGLAYTENLGKGIFGGAAIGAGLRAFTGKNGGEHLVDVASDAANKSPILEGLSKRFTKYKDAILEPAFARKIKEAREIVAKNGMKGGLFGAAAGVGLVGAHNIINYETTRFLGNKRPNPGSKSIYA